MNRSVTLCSLALIASIVAVFTAFVAFDITYVTVLQSGDEVSRVLTSDGSVMQVDSTLLRSGTAGTWLFPAETVFISLTSAVFAPTLFAASRN